jgi:hypothetical protein
MVTWYHDGTKKLSLLDVLTIYKAFRGTDIVYVSADTGERQFTSLQPVGFNITTDGPVPIVEYEDFLEGCPTNLGAVNNGYVELPDADLRLNVNIALFDNAAKQMVDKVKSAFLVERYDVTDLVIFASSPDYDDIPDSIFIGKIIGKVNGGFAVVYYDLFSNTIEATTLNRIVHVEHL